MGKKMTKIRKTFVCMMVAVLLILPVGNAFASDMQITFDGDYLQFGPIIVDDRSLLPARFMTDLLGGETEWEPDYRRVTLTLGERIIVLYIDSDIAFVDGEEVELDVAAMIYDDRTFVPLRFVGENFGVDVDFCEDTRTIILTTPLAAIQLVAITENVQRLSQATITVIGQPDTLHEITVMFATGSSRAQGLEPAYSDGYGYVSWTWTIGSGTTFGTWPITITQAGENGETLVVYFNVVE